MTVKSKPKSSIESNSRRGLVNGNGFAGARGRVNGNYRATGLVNGLGRVNGTGLTNGMGRVNGVGKTNGLSRTSGRVNGIGHVNGIGMTNGLRRKGFVNGHGLVNGIRRPLSSNIYGIVTNKDLRIGVSLAVLFVLLLPSFYLIVSPPQPRPPAISVDGQFADWTGVPTYHDVVGSPNPNIAITDYALLHEEETLFVFLKVEAQLFMESSAYDGFYAFLDCDGRQATGYWPEEIGAEYAVFITGGEGRIATSELRRLTPSADPLNWSAWETATTVPSAFIGNSMEFAIGLHALNLTGNYALRLAANDFSANSVLASLKIGREYGALKIEQSPRTELTPLTPSNSTALHLSLHAFGKRAEIRDFPANAHWETYPSNLRNRLSLPNQIFIDGGDTVDLDVDLDLTGLRRGEPVWLNLTGLDANVPVTLHGEGGVAYVEQLPRYKTIDGWFGDWQTGLQTDTGLPLANPNVDISAYASNITRIGAGGSAFFFVDFVGHAMRGSVIPSMVSWPTPSQAAPPSPASIPRRVAGEDMLAISIDADTNSTAGCDVHGFDADARLEIRGHAKKVDSRTLYTCTSNAWVHALQTPLAMASGSKIEVSVELSLLGVLDQPRYLIESTDWSGDGDMLPYGRLGTRSTDGTRSIEAPRLLANPPGVNSTVSKFMSSDPVINGECDDSVYGEATLVEDYNKTFMFYVGHTASWVFVCIILDDDTIDVSDNASIMFDTKHNAVGNEGPQDDDRLFTIFAGTDVISRRRGDGTAWVDCDSTSCADGDTAAASFYLSQQNYEFSINRLNVWDGTTAGFAILLYDASGPTTYSWGSWSVSWMRPGSWGHLDIPEFPVIIVPILIAVALTGFRRKRRHA